MNIKGIFKGTVISFSISFLSLIICAFLVYHNICREQTISVWLFIGVSLGLFIGALIAAKHAYSRIILNSLSVSLLFIISVIITSISVNGSFSLHTRTTVLIISTVATGILGAIFGRS